MREDERVQLRDALFRARNSNAEMDALIERVAKFVYEQPDGETSDVFPWDKATDWERREMLKGAREAIKGESK
jgi:hypothetical protein